MDTQKMFSVERGTVQDKIMGQIPYYCDICTIKLQCVLNEKYRHETYN